MNDLSRTDFSVPSWTDALDRTAIARDLETSIIAKVRAAIAGNVLDESVEIVERAIHPTLGQCFRPMRGGPPAVLVACVPDDESPLSSAEFWNGITVELLLISGRCVGWMRMAEDMVALLCGKSPSPDVACLETLATGSLRSVRGYPDVALLCLRTSVALRDIDSDPVSLAL